MGGSPVCVIYMMSEVGRLLQHEVMLSAAVWSQDQLQVLDYSHNCARTYLLYWLTIQEAWHH